MLVRNQVFAVLLSFDCDPSKNHFMRLSANNFQEFSVEFNFLNLKLEC